MKTGYKNAITPLLALAAAGAFAPRALASGFQLREQSPSAQGSAFAGISARGADIGSMFFNPATLTAFEGFQLVAGGSFVAPRAELGSASATRASLSGPLAPYGGTAVTGPSRCANSAKSAVVPNLYAMWSVGRDLRLGLSVNAPFGLVTEYDPGFVGRYHALRSDLKTVDTALSAAYRVAPMLSVGASVLRRKVDAELSNAVDFGQIAFLSLAQAGSPAYASFAPSAAASPFDGRATIHGSGTATGFKAGLVFEPSAAFRAGLSYHGATRVSLEGDVAYDYPAIASAPLAGAMGAVAAGAHLVNGAVRSEVELPASLSLGLSWDAAPGLALGLEASQTRWSRFQELRMRFASGQADSVTREDWRDTWFCSLGATWRFSEALTLRAGLARDPGAAPDGTRTPRIPDGDRTWLSAGLGWALTKSMVLDFALTHILVQDSTLALHAGAPGDPDYFRGNLGGTFSNGIDLAALSLRCSF